ncbi:MAG: betaine--homocysteine S-methyltransferase [Rhodospirillales bacterium]|nr:betaine--homocysteine S-methyltransferase [Rhodospirillales bacterium]MBO6785690.1 betaine--homocysteine S-methyltransferase [Rhodospirillales bacterium]
MSDLLSRLLAERDWLLCDGAMGTSLFQRGLETGEAPDLWNVTNADKVADVHQGFVDAGSDIFLTNSFGANALRLKLHGDQDRVREINVAAAQVARKVADAAGRPVVVAGSMGPTGELMEPMGALTPDDAEKVFAEQALALKEGGVDVLWIETMSSKEEYAAAAAGAAQTGLPVVATMSFDTNGRTMMGVTPEEAASFASALEPGLVAYGCNCGVGPATLIDTVLGMKKTAAPTDVITAKGNCGIPEYRDGQIAYTGSPEIMQEYARMARDAGARIIGGCCGTTDIHVRAMAEALKDYVAGEAPDRERIERALGPVDQPLPKKDDADDRGRRRRRRA